MDSVGSKAISSSGWGFLDKGVGFVVQFVIGIILARLLPPSDFGLVGLAMIVVGFGEIFVNLGLGPALIQKKGVSERHIRIVLTTSVIAGVVITITFFLAAPIFALILDNQNVVPVIKVLSFLFIIAGFQIPSQALLIKRLNFRQIFYVSFTKSIIYGIVTIALALLGFGVWSLVIGNICIRIANTLGNYFYVRHSIKPLFAKKEFFDLAHFGSGETLSGIFSYFALKGDYFIIGKLLGEEALGLYTKAYTLMQMPTSRFVSVITNVLFPTAAKLQTDDARLRRVFLRSMSAISFFTLPMFVLIVIVAPELIIGLYGNNWEGTIVPLQILGGFGVFRAMYNASASFLKAKGLVYQIFYAQVIYGIFILATVWFSSINFGLVGAAWAVGFSIFIMWCIMMELNVRIIDISRLDIIHTLKPGLILSLIVFLTVKMSDFIIGNFINQPLLALVIFLIIGVMSIVIAVMLIPQQWFNFVVIDLLNSIENTTSTKLKIYIQRIRNHIS